MVPGEDHFTGTVEIELDIRQPVSTIWLHGKSLVFREASIRAEDTDQTASVEPAANDFVAVTVPNNLPLGHALLRISYAGEISRVLTDGAFQQKQGTDWYIFTKFEPVTARRVFPCFDEPSFKTPWQLTLHVPKALKAFSNTPIASEQDEANDTKAVRFQQTKPLPSYLVAFAAGPFDIVDTAPAGKNHTPSRIIVPRGRVGEAAYAASITPKLIEMLEGYFGTPYPYEKLDQVVVPLTTSWGAMENAGLIAYGDFLLSPKQDDTDLRQRARARTMEHEMSHQWFGDLVTTAWWDDIWLNEAFASWLSTKLLDQWKPEWHLKTDAARSIGILRADSLTTARKIHQPIEAPGDIANAFDGITYGKGEAVIGMFENYVGPEKFQRAIRLYLQQHAWGNATSADLLAAVDQISGPGIGTAFSTFLDQTGFPLVTAKVLCLSEFMGAISKNQTWFQMEQKRFLPAGSPGKSDAVWEIPVCVVWKDADQVNRQCVLLSHASEDFDIEAKGCPTEFFADANAAGYYAVSYEPQVTENLVRKAMPELKPSETAAALRNVQLLFSSAVGDPTQELTSLSEFSRNSDPALVRQAASSIGSIRDLVPAEQQEEYAQLIRSLYQARARELGWNPSAGESQEIRLLRMEIVPLVAMEGGDTDLQSQATELAHEWLKERRGIDPDIVPAVLSTVAWNGDRAFFDLLVGEIKKDKVQRERAWMIDALSSFRDPAIARSALDLLFGSGIDPRELQSLLFGAPIETRDLVWKFVQQHFDQLNSTLPGARGIPFGATLPLTASGFCDSQHGAEVEAFFRSRISALPGGARNLANTLERIRLCSARVAIVEPALVNFLKSYHQTRNANSDAFRLGFR